MGRDARGLTTAQTARAINVLEIMRNAPAVGTSTPVKGKQGQGLMNATELLTSTIARERSFARPTDAQEPIRQDLSNKFKSSKGDLCRTELSMVISNAQRSGSFNGARY